MHSSNYIIAGIVAFAIAVATPQSTYAGNAPAWHSGSFSKTATLKTCLNFAATAIQKERCKILVRENHMLIAGNDNVIVQVSCAPGSSGTTRVVVTAYSQDSSLAEATRNRVREYIVKTVLID